MAECIVQAQLADRAGFAWLWTSLTGRRVIGLATATNAARVLQSEGLAESYNIAEFLGKIEGSGELRRPVPLHENDVLVLDEASQLATSDLAMVQEAARIAGARLILVGDTEQLGAVEAGGMFRLLAQEVPGVELHEVRRFAAAWEAGASVRLRAGDFTAYADYDRHGKMRSADQDAAMDRAASMWLADHLRGKTVLLLAGSNSEAAELSRRVQAKLIQLGAVQRPHATLADGNQAGTGDLIRARLNTTINAAGRELTNRDTLQITGWHGPNVQVRRRELDGTWTSPFLVPRLYLAESAELDYAGSTHVGQGRTVDTGPHRGNPELDHLRQTAIRALELRDDTEITRRMTRGELEARILDGDRAQASAPPDVSRDLRLTAQAEADAWQQAADAETTHDPVASARAKALARHLAAQREQLEAVNARYETWAVGTSSKREAAGKARAELERRGLARQAAEQRQPGAEGEPMVEWWRQLEADLAGVDQAIEREHQAAIAAGKPWPPEHTPQPESGPVREPENSPGSDPEAYGRPGPDDQAARLDELLAQAAEAAGRFSKERADREGKAEYAARLEREAHAEPEHTLQADASHEAEIEL